MGSRLVGDLLTILVIFGLVAAVTLLPPDTSLAEIDRTGRLRVCVPDSYPPLVTGDPERPGLDIELLRAVAERMGLTLLLNTNSAMGRDFNPRNWRVTRAQCQVLAGGVVVSDLTRSFLETTPPHLDTGWAIVWPGGPLAAPPGSAAPETAEGADGLAALSGAPIGFHSGLAGLDRLALSSALRAAGVRARVVNSPEALAEGIRSGSFAAGITEAVLARQIAAANGWQAAWLPGDLGRTPLSFGLWKGDLTLKRKLVEVLGGLAADGTIERLRSEYGVEPIAQFP